MDTNELIKLTGELTVTKTNEITGEIEQFTVPNLVVNAGKYFIASRMVGTASGVMSHMGIGTGTTAAAAGDTALGTAAGARQSATGTQGSGGSANVITYTATFPAGVGTGAVTEAGIFNALTGGDMLCRTVFSAVNKGANDSIAITWNVTVS